MRRWRIRYNQIGKKTGREGTGCSVWSNNTFEGQGEISPLYKMVVRQAMMYDAWTCAVKKARGEVGCGEMRMLRWMSEVTKLGRMSEVTKLGRMSEVTKLGRMSEVTKLGRMSEVTKLGRMSEVTKLGRMSEVTKLGRMSEVTKLGRMSEVTKLGRIINERNRGTTKVGKISKKVQESRFKWYGYT